MYGTCETIVSAEIINVCDIVISRLDTLIELTNTNGKEKKLKKLRKRRKYLTLLRIELKRFRLKR